ncbi:hypothetical protein BDV97DRAFT_360350 [Delphinella strobiligena]|nr:hypothetical protein BDV97DRAFT_360350 [Delphinella strobiligena]
MALFRAVLSWLFEQSLSRLSTKLFINDHRYTRLSSGQGYLRSGVDRFHQRVNAYCLFPAMHLDYSMFYSDASPSRNQRCRQPILKVSDW